jgi:hypothetical protein
MSYEPRKRAMKHGVFACLFMFATSSAVAAKGPEVDLVDNKLSVTADAVPLGRLLQLVDLATGMKSKVPPELANRNMSVRFSGLNITDGIRKMFQGQPLDYVVIEGQGIIVTGASQTVAGNDVSPAFNPPPQPVPSFDQPFTQEFPPVPGQVQPPLQPQQPAMIQTPFGAMPNPRAQPVPSAVPAVNPGQQNSLFQQPGQALGQPAAQPNMQQQPGFCVPGQQPGVVPFGGASPFITPSPPQTNPNNSLFNSTPIFGTQTPQQR